MSDYKLVPVEPTSEMVEAAEDAYMPFGDMELAIRMALLAAPDVQGEPVGEVRFELGAPSSIFAELYSKSLPVLAPGTKLYTAPQPAEQKPASAYACTVPDDCETLHWRGQILSMNELASVAQPTAGEEIMVNAPGDVYTLPMQPSGLTSGPRFVVHVPAQPAEQQPAPDVEALVEALSIARDYVFSSLEEKKLALAGYPQMWRCEQDDLAMIDATLSAYRKETSHDK